jgi:predicted dithiol-disulfide oxidoreductase (DUF899 family)
MENPLIVSRDAWLTARRELLREEKALTRQRDEVARRRRGMPWVRIDKPYAFDTTRGTESLADLFAGRSQLIIYHFMFPERWEEGCKSCSFWLDNFNGIAAHLAQRDVTLLAVSRSPLPKLQAFKQRMGWDLEWASSLGSEFNFDFGVSFTPEEMATGEVTYNYQQRPFPVEEAPGVSVFQRNAQQEIFHTYSCYSRGLDMLNGAYQLLDLVPKGRAEDGLPYSMAWLRLHDSYDV